MSRDRLYGIGEPLTSRGLHGDLDPMVGLELMDAMGCTAFREWMHIPDILSDPITPKPKAVEAYTRTLNRCKELDIEVTGMSHKWFLPDGSISGAENLKRDIAPGSEYRKMLEMLETSWCTLASIFPQVTQWEVGNEWNIDIFLHPVGWHYGLPSFSLEEKMDIAVDMMYFSARGIRRGNPEAKVVSFSPTVQKDGLPYFIPCQYGMALALEKVYQRIESGNFWSTKSDDFFDLLAWHPYLPTQMTYAPILENYPAASFFNREEAPDALWRGYNDAAYNVMVRHGDGHKKVLLTEFGFSDKGDPEWEKRQAELFRMAFDIAKTMPYIKTLHSFRLFEQESMGQSDDPGTISGTAEVYFGFFREPRYHYAPRNKAYALQNIYGGKGTLKR